MATSEIPLSHQQAENLTRFLSSPTARLNNLYWIINKNGQRIRFSLNWAQTELHNTAHTRNNILKVRQLGMSTYIAMLILDSCLFNPHFTAGIVDKTLKDAESKLSKIALAYQSLDYIPDNPSPLDTDLAAIGAMLKKHFDGTSISAQSISFPNGSNVTIGTSIRGGTLQLLHISELGSIAAHDPGRATEIITGSLNTVGKNCRIYMESTHEGGKYGVNYENIISSMDMIGKPLTPLDFKFYFFPWFKHPEYTLPSTPHPSVEQTKYFQAIEKQCDTIITPGQRAWYCAMERVQRSKMRQEYPSTPDEALNSITDGTIYAAQITSLRERGLSSAAFEPDPHRPIYTSWDIGIADYMSIWWIQPDGRGKWLILDNYTANQKPISHYISIIRDHDALWGKCTACVVPHDGARHTLDMETQDESISRAGYNVIRVPRTSNLWISVDNTREFLTTCVFHERCSEPTDCDGVKYISGLDALANYRVAPPGNNGTIARQPLHDLTSHAADAIRTFADAVHHGLISPSLGWANAPRRHHRSSYVDSMTSR